MDCVINLKVGESDKIKVIKFIFYKDILVQPIYVGLLFLYKTKNLIYCAYVLDVSKGFLRDINYHNIQQRLVSGFLWSSPWAIILCDALESVITCVYLF